MVRTIGSDGAKTEEAIRAAAIRLIAAHGFEAVTLRDLAKEVGIQPGSLYRYYGSKAALLLTLMVTHLEHLLGEWHIAKRGLETPKERLHAFVEFHVHYHSQKKNEVLIGNMEIRSLNDEHRQIVSTLRAQYENELYAILDDGVKSGEFIVRDIRVATFAILAMLTGLTAWYREGGRLSKRELVACYADLIFGGVTKPT
jgi:AcrR family transcriptional regulator